MQKTFLIFLGFVMLNAAAGAAPIKLQTPTSLTLPKAQLATGISMVQTPAMATPATNILAKGSSTGDTSTTPVSDNWGTPKVGDSHIDADGNIGVFRLRDGWSISNDDQSIVTFMARKYVSHGGYFCMTQIYVGSGTKFWTDYQRPKLPRIQCVWLCEPGFEGENCAKKTNMNSACDTTEYSKEYFLKGNNDMVDGYRATKSLKDDIDMMDTKYQGGVYEHDIIVGIYSFLDNKHGIKARPMIVSAVGDHPAITYLKAQPANGGIMKTLCAQGYSGPDCTMSSQNCGKDLWCSGFETGFDSKIHEKVATDTCYKYKCQGGLTMNSSTRACSECETTLRQGIDTKTGECVQCSLGQYFDDSDNICKPAKALSKEVMQYGATAARDMLEQCWTMDDPDSYAACVTQ